MQLQKQSFTAMRVGTYTQDIEANGMLKRAVPMMITDEALNGHRCVSKLRLKWGQ